MFGLFQMEKMTLETLADPLMEHPVIVDTSRCRGLGKFYCCGILRERKSDFLFRYVSVVLVLV